MREYNLIGVLMGLAVYNGIILDLHLPSICYRKLLSPPVVPAPSPSSPGESTSNVGHVAHPSLDDLAEIMPDVARSLRELLLYEGDVEEDLMLTFEVSVDEYGSVITGDLKQGNGKNVNVTQDNRSEFVRSAQQ